MLNLASENVHLFLLIGFARNFSFKDMKFYAFDSFEGLPKAKGKDKCYLKEGDYKCSLKKFKENLKKAKVNLDKVIFVKGWYNKTLKQDYNIKKLSAVHIDCDYYESTKDVLQFIKPLLQEGTIILFDDWHLFKGNPNYGEPKAFSEFIKENKDLFFTEVPCLRFRRMFITHKK